MTISISPVPDDEGAKVWMGTANVAGFSNYYFAAPPFSSLRICCSGGWTIYGSKGLSIGGILIILTSPLARVTAKKTQSNESLTSYGNFVYFWSTFNSGVSGLASSGTQFRE